MVYKVRIMYFLNLKKWYNPSPKSQFNRTPLKTNCHITTTSSKFQPNLFFFFTKWSFEKGIMCRKTYNQENTQRLITITVSELLLSSEAHLRGSGHIWFETALHRTIMKICINMNHQKKCTVFLEMVNYTFKTRMFSKCFSCCSIGLYQHP